MTIERMQRTHARDVAALHAAALGGLLTRLGLPAVRAYYDACAGSPHSTAFVALDGSRLLGFVTGAASPRALRGDVVQRNPIGFGIGALASLLNPSALVDLMRSTISEPAYDSGAPELIYLAVDASQRGRGAGQDLVNAFSHAMRNAGHLRYELSVDARNAEAQRFYERLGFKRIGTYNEFDTTQIRYAMRLKDSAP